MWVRASSRLAAVGIVLVGCGAAVTGTALRWSAPARGPKTTSSVGAQHLGDALDPAIAARFAELRLQNRDITYPELATRLALERAPETGPSFDPTTVEYWPRIRDSLELTAEEQALYRRYGLVGVDHVQRYSMASAYLAIYRRDLPVLITTDSVLHALHRSFDAILAELETEHFYPSLVEVLGKAHTKLGAEASGLAAPALRQAAEDVDLYLTVARNLLVQTADERRGNPRCILADEDPSCPDDPTAAALTADLQIEPVLGAKEKIREVLAAIAAQKAGETPALYGRRNVQVDWSQFTPRGHYTKSPLLRRYFRTLMWLGRVDLGFVLAPPDGAFGKFDVPRERLDAALVSWLLRQTGYVDTLAAMDRAIGFFVGLTDDVTVKDVVSAAERAGVRGFGDLADPAKVDAIPGELTKAGVGGQRIRSQIGFRMPGGSPDRPLPQVLQMFGQRFVLDSFFLSKLVFDSIEFKGSLPERTMPIGLDVAAVFGNDEAVALLEPELVKWSYGANLLAARRIVEDRQPSLWNTTLYDIWLSTLAKLDDVPAEGELPEVMRARPWQRKQLQTQLASWAELRHDTILYAKQSYTMGIICEYPTGYVEPYPDVYGRLALFAEEASRRLADLRLADPQVGPFLAEFAGIMRKLEGLARKELAAQPFTREERGWVKDAIQAKTVPGGCGPPEVIYTGWYPKLLYQGGPEVWEPTVADVHTDPNSRTVLEVAVGDANFLVAAIDNEGDRAAYVGPVYSYYEFTSDTRLTDKDWRTRINDGKVPARPEWTRLFQAKPQRRARVPVR